MAFRGEENRLAKAERILGLSLGGGKSDRTALAVIDYYPNQKKAFLIDVYDSLGPQEDQSADQILLAVLEEVAEDSRILVVDVPLSLPPCFLGCHSRCAEPSKCKKPAVKWMVQQQNRMKSQKGKVKAVTPYSQRPVDLYFRYENPDQDLFQDETMGANLAPRLARMQYLRTRLPRKLQLFESWPKLSLFSCKGAFGLSSEEALAYRNLEEGIRVREQVLDALSEDLGLFVYERDLKKCAVNPSAFDALIGAWVGLCQRLGKVHEFRKNLPLNTGWVVVPKV